MDTNVLSVGVHPTSTDESMPPVELALEAEARGLRAISLPEHTHVPVAAEDVAPRYQRTLDPYIASAFVAAATTLEVGTAVSLIAQHDAIALAKAIATLDHMSGGRVMIGVGFGYSREEAANHGVPLRERALVVEETVRLMRALWTQDEAAFEGRHVSVSPSRAWPKPVRPAGPPILLGARATTRNFERIVEWGDGWIPMAMGVLDDAFQRDLDDLRVRWNDAGRASDLEVCCFFMPNDAAHMARELERAVELGVQRMQVYLEDRDRDAALPVLDDIAVALERLEISRGA
jgi:probable F420-dependent oxidoreductase